MQQARCTWRSEDIFCGEKLVSEYLSGGCPSDNRCLPGAFKVAAERGEIDGLARRVARCVLVRGIGFDCLGIDVRPCVDVVDEPDELCLAKPIAVGPALRVIRYVDPRGTVFSRGYALLGIWDAYRLVEALVREFASRYVEVRRRERSHVTPVPRGEQGSSGRSRFPPCIGAIMDSVRRGDEVPHHARFALAAFLLNIGWSVDEVVDVFRTVPDFNEKVTRYQVEHIAGLRGGKTRYSAPSCDWMRSHGLCVSECNVANPVQYYFRSGRRRRGRVTVVFGGNDKQG